MKRRLPDWYTVTYEAADQRYGSAKPVESFGQFELKIVDELKPRPKQENTAARQLVSVAPEPTRVG